MRHREQPHGSRTGTRTACAAGIAACVLCGCNALSYDRLRVGTPVSEYAPLLSTSTSRTTTAGICDYSEDLAGNPTAFVGFVTEDRRLAGKLIARRSGGGWGAQRSPSYALEGEIAPELYLSQDVGPLDTLRHAAGSLISAGEETVSRSAYELVAAGLIRLIERWPKAALDGADSRRIGEITSLADSTGDATITIMHNGWYRFSYIVRKED